MERNGTIDNKNTEVVVFDYVVTLKLHVDSWHEKNEAGRIAWSTPTVKQVKNDLFVDFAE